MSCGEVPLGADISISVTLPFNGSASKLVHSLKRRKVTDISVLLLQNPYTRAQMGPEYHFIALELRLRPLTVDIPRLSF